MKLNSEKTQELVNFILGAGSEYGAGQSLVRRYIKELAGEIHEGHILIVEGADRIHNGEPIEENMILIDRGYDILKKCLNKIEQRLVSNPNCLDSETHGIALMKDGLQWLGELIQTYQPLFDEYREENATDIN